MQLITPLTCNACVTLVQGERQQCMFLFERGKRDALKKYIMMKGMRKAQTLENVKGDHSQNCLLYLE